MNHYKSKLRSSKGFTLIEVLTVIAIIAILSAILVPTVTQMQATARKTKDLSNMRQIINASQVFASQNGDLMPQPGHSVANNALDYVPGATTDRSIGEVAAVLAVGAGLNDLNIWISDSDTKAMKLNGPTPVIVGGVMNPDIANTNPLDTVDPGSGFISFEYVLGLTLQTPSQTPIIFSRLSNSGASEWGPTDIYGGQGGHIGFAGGSVQWFESSPGEAAFTKLFKGDGTPATNMDSALTLIPSTTPKIASN